MVMVTSRSVEDESLYTKIGWRLLPILIVSYMLAYMDRVNISFAKLEMQQDIGISEAAYGFAAGIFFIGYVIFEVPSNLLLARIGARRTLSRIMFLWGATTVATMFVADATSLYVLRFLLGVFEAGFGPGMIYFLTLWYGRRRRARVLSYVLLAAPVGGILGGPLATGIMAQLGGVMGLKGWQWLFVIEGLPCVLLGIILYRYLDDGPQHATWLSDAERLRVSASLDATGAPQHTSFRNMLNDPRIYILAFSYFGLVTGLYSISFWLPTLLKAAGVQDTLSMGLYYAMPYGAALISMVLFARHSDSTGERRWHAAIATGIGAIFLGIASLSLHNFGLCMATLTIAICAIYSGYTVFWTIPTDYLSGSASAGGIAFINSIGLLGGFVSPIVIGWLKTETGSLSAGLLVMSLLLLLSAATIILNRLSPTAR